MLTLCFNKCKVFHICTFKNYCMAIHHWLKLYINQDEKYIMLNKYTVTCTSANCYNFHVIGTETLDSTCKVYLQLYVCKIAHWSISIQVLLELRYATHVNIFVSFVSWHCFKMLMWFRFKLLPFAKWHRKWKANLFKVQYYKNWCCCCWCRWFLPLYFFLSLSNCHAYLPLGIQCLHIAESDWSKFQNMN